MSDLKSSDIDISEGQLPSDPNPGDEPTPTQAMLNEWLETGRLIWPHLILTLVLSCLCVFGLGRFFGASALGKPNMVVFDIIKYTNAQRMLASKLVSQAGGGGDAAMLLRDVNQRTLSELQRVAKSVGGTGVVIMVKQSVLSAPGAFDITDQVLSELGLPTNAPSTADFISEPVTSLTGSSAEIVSEAKRAVLGRNLKQMQEEENRASTGDNEKALP